MHDPRPVDSMAADVTVVRVVAHGGRHIDLLGVCAIPYAVGDVVDDDCR